MARHLPTNATRALASIALALALAPVVHAQASPASGACPSRSSRGVNALARDFLTPGWDPRPAASNPHQAAQLGIDWLTRDLCAWMQTTGQGTDCATGRTDSCMGCHVQAETVLGLARSTARCYTLPSTPCQQPGDESPIQFAARFIAACQRKPCIIGPYNTTCTTTYGVIPVDLNTRDGQPPELGSIGHYPDCGSNAPPASIHPIIQSAHAGLNLAGYARYVSPAYASNLLALADWFLTK